MRNNLLASFSSTWPYASLPEGDAQCLCVTRRTCFLFFSGATLSNRCLRDFAARAACILINSNLGPDQGWSKNKDISPDSTPSSQHAAISREGRGRECAMNCIDWFFFSSVVVVGCFDIFSWRVRPSTTGNRGSSIWIGLMRFCRNNVFFLACCWWLDNEFAMRRTAKILMGFGGYRRNEGAHHKWSLRELRHGKEAMNPYSTLFSGGVCRSWSGLKSWENCYCFLFVYTQKIIFYINLWLKGD